MRGILSLVHLLLIAGTFAISCDYYGGFNIDIPEWFRYFVGFGVIGISILWTIVHIVGGSLMGMAGGTALDGLKMGLFIGGAASIGRLWPYAFAWAGGAFIYAPGSDILHTIIPIVAGFVFLIVNFVVKYLWSQVEG
jgi:hypothetical protein